MALARRTHPHRHHPQQPGAGGMTPRLRLPYYLAVAVCMTTALLLANLTRYASSATVGEAEAEAEAEAASDVMCLPP